MESAASPRAWSRRTGLYSAARYNLSSVLCVRARCSPLKAGRRSPQGGRIRDCARFQSAIWGSQACSKGTLPRAPSRTRTWRRLAAHRVTRPIPQSADDTYEAAHPIWCGDPPALFALSINVGFPPSIEGFSPTLIVSAALSVSLTVLRTSLLRCSSARSHGIAIIPPASTMPVFLALGTTLRRDYARSEMKMRGEMRGLIRGGLCECTYLSMSSPSD